jgi:hypothetical protein
MSLQDLANDAALTPERPSQVSLDPTQPTREELLAREQQARQAQQPVPPQQGPGVAFARLGPTNPAQVALTNPAVPQVGAPPDEAEKDPTKLALAEEGTPQATDTTGQGPAPATEAPIAPLPDYKVNPPAIYRPPPHRPVTQSGDDWFATKAAQAYPGVAPGPDMPSPQEAYGNALDANSQSARWASRPVADAYSQANVLLNPLAAIADAFSKGKFSQSYSTAALRGLQIRQYEWLEQQRQANELHQQDLSGVNRIAKMEQANLITHQQAMDMMRDYLINSQHDNYLPILRDHGTAGVYKLYQIEDANWRRSHASEVQLRKALDTDGRDEIRKQFGFGPGTGSDTAGMGGGRLDVETPRAAPEAAPLTGDLSVFNALPKEAQDTAREIFKGRNVLGLDRLNKVDPVNAGKIDQMARGLDAETRKAVQVQDPDPNKSMQQKLADKDARLAKIDQELPGILRAVTTYQVDPKSEEGKRWDAAAQAYDPRYKPGNFANAQRWFNKDSNERKVVDRASQIPQAAINVYKNLNVFDEDASVIQNKLQQWTAGLLGNDDRFKVAFDAIFDLEQHVQAVASLTGTPRVTTLMAKIQNLGSTATPMQVRGAIAPDLISSYRILEHYQGDYESSTNRRELLPGNDPHNMRVFRDIVRMNTKTGEPPPDAQPEVRAIGVDPSKRRKDLLEDETRTPLPMKTIFALSRKYQELASSPDPDKRQQAREYLQRVPPIIGITDPIPGVDEGAP